MSAGTCRWHRPCPKPGDELGYCHHHNVKLRKAGLLHGGWTDPELAKARLEQHHQRGTSMRVIAEATGLSLRAIQRIRAGQRTAIHVNTHLKIMAVEFRARPARPTDVGCVRRIQALRWMGHSLPGICARSGMGLGGLKTALTRGTFTDGMARKIDAGYEALCATPGTCRKTAADAKRRGFAPPLAWDDIDDPAAVPDLGTEKPLTAEYLRSEVAHLTALGMSPEKAAEKLHATAAQLAREDRDCARCGHRFMPDHTRQDYCDPCRPLAESERHDRYRAAKQAARTTTGAAA